MKTRDQIIQTMYDVIAEKGYDNCSMGQIADIIGIKKASLYYYFKSKEEIFIEMIKLLYEDGGFDGKNDEYKIDFENITISNYKETVIEAGVVYIDSYINNIKLRKVYAEIDMQTIRIPALREYNNVSNKILMESMLKVLDYGIKINVFPKDFNREENAELLYIVFLGLDDAILYGSPIDPKKVWKTSIDKVFK